MEEQGIEADHATLNRWVMRYLPLIAEEARKQKCKVGTPWRMDETDVKLKGK